MRVRELPRTRLTARGLQHPLPDRHDQARLLCERDEGQRRHQPVDRMLPAEERLDGHDPARPQVDKWLVVQS